MKQLYYIIFLLCTGTFLHAQQVRLPINTKHTMNILYQYGIADAFIDGLYEGTMPIKTLKEKGDFGLGAPDMLDGELTMLDGKVYQTKATGETVEPDDGFTTALFFTTFFKADTTFTVMDSIEEKALYEQINSVLKTKNTPHAVKIIGSFDLIKTRAFPPILQAPFPSIISIFDTQHFFDYTGLDGTLVGYYIPEYLNGINTKGFHFHFLSSDKKEGGHVLSFTGRNLQVSIFEIARFQLELPNDNNFRKFEFDVKDNEALKRIEQGQ